MSGAPIVDVVEDAADWQAALQASEAST